MDERQWLPISTAPKDGFEFEALCGNTLCCAYWNSESDRFNISDNTELDRNDLHSWRPMSDG
jgi:hypothetical protein